MSRRPGLALTFALAAAGPLTACGSGSAATDGGTDGIAVDAALAPGACLPRGGTRLAPEGYALEGGERVATGWWDATRGESCSFQRDPAGTLRCFPSADVVYTFGRYFLDEACAEATMLLPAAACDADVPRYVGESVFEACTSGLVLYPVTELVEAASGRGVYVLDEVGTCQLAGTVSAERLARVGPALAPTDLVAATVEVGPARGRFAPVALRADDGAEDTCPIAGAGRLHDVALGVSCGLGTTADGATRCLPDASELTSYFSEPGCLTPAAYADPTCLPPAYARRYTGGTCASLVELLPITTEVTTIFGFDGVSCQALDVDADSGFFGVGPAADPGSFEKLTRVETTRAGRLAPVVWSAPDGAELATGRFADGPLGGQECEVVTATDGAPRCLPAGVGHGAAAGFSDPGCAVPVLYTQVDATCTPVLTHVTRDVSDGCGATREVYRVVEELTAVYVADGGLGCVLGFRGGDGSTTRLLSLEVAEPSRFVGATPTRW